MRGWVPPWPFAPEAVDRKVNRSSRSLSVRMIFDRTERAKGTARQFLRFAPEPPFPEVQEVRAVHAAHTVHVILTARQDLTAR